MSQVVANAFISLFALGVRFGMTSGAPAGVLQWDGREMPNLTASQSHAYSQLPQNLEAALKLLSLEGKVTVHATCPSCHMVYSPSYKRHATIPDYPSTCNNTIVSDKVHVPNRTCNTSLLRIRSGKLVPMRPYATASIADYLAREMANPEVEAYCDTACDEAFAASPSSDPNDAPLDTIFEASFLQNLIGPEGGSQRFIERRDGKARVVLGIHTDWFNPNGNKQRGASESIGVINIVNMALPPHLRNKPEHMLVYAIIPGPKEPPLDTISHYLRPVIDEALRGWVTGFTISTSTSSARNVNIVLAVSINDLPAARKVAGLASHSSAFYCSVCANVGKNLNYPTDYALADGKALKPFAVEWRDCLDTKRRNEIFETCGVRWSEFWRLPYWDPTEMLPIDPMHAGMEGNVHYFSRHVLQLDASVTLDGDNGCYTFPWPSYDPESCTTFLRLSTEKAVQQFNDKMPVWLATPLGGEPAVTRETIHKRILQGTSLPVLRLYAIALNLPVPLVEKIKATHHSQWDTIRHDNTYKDEYVTALLDWVS